MCGRIEDDPSMHDLPPGFGWTFALDAEVQRVTGPAAVLAAIETEDGAGVVLVQRAHPVHPYIVWRWATKLTDGSPVGGPTGAMLWSGGYCATKDEARDEYAARLPRGRSD